jgi:hypothetical protein
MSNIYGLKFYEIKVFFDNEEGEERLTRKEVNFSTFKALGVIKTFNSTKKLNDWLNTDEGRIFMVEKINDKYNHYFA